ncbi:hypothetical protein FOL47_003249 [Perkinsus chesapeaki]|uniref:RRM domain-containing protein n=1 Tax=Perkinsus chesapeaki TaxID=330153 RepID=A0A7J6N3Q2_PERCH|nr:hypothetical protein FOL47_003249 [Perkinsus chesapeaki]
MDGTTYLKTTRIGGIDQVVRDSWGRSRCFAFVRFAHTSCALHVKRHADRQQIVAYDRFGTGWTIGATWAKNPNKAGEKENKKKSSKGQKKKDKQRASPSVAMPLKPQTLPPDEAARVTEIAQRLRDDAIRSLTARQQQAMHLSDVVSSVLGVHMNTSHQQDFITPTSRIWPQNTHAPVPIDNPPVQALGPMLIPRSLPNFFSMDDLQRSPAASWASGLQQQLLYSDTPSTSPVFTPVPLDQQSSSLAVHQLSNYAPSYSGIPSHPFGLCNTISSDNSSPPSTAS